MPQLWDGAVSVTIPSHFEDASRFRPVPDHQEVWVPGKNSPDSCEGQSVIFEINEYQNVTGADAVKHHLNDIAQTDNAQLVDVESFNRPCPNVKVNGNVHGEHWIGKATMQVGQHAAARKGDVVHVGILVLRFKALETDVLAIVNVQQAEPSADNQGQNLAAVASQACEEILESVHSSIQMNWPEFYQLFGTPFDANAIT